VGHWDSKDVSLAQAVAASSAFPPVLSPVTIKLKGRRFTPFPDARHAPPPKLYLTDGGVYDNLGIESVWKQAGTAYVSDAGANFHYEPKGTFLMSSQALRVTFIMQDQIGALRFRQILNAFETTDTNVRRDGFLVSSDFFIEPRPAGGPPYERGLAEDLAATPTRLSRMDETRAMRLVNWGYIATDDRVRGKGLPAGRCELPYPQAPLV
jgi:NTE family protein